MKTNLIIGIIVLIVILFCLTGCKDNGVSKNLVYNKTTNKTTNKTNTQTTTSVDYEAAAQKQMATPEKGETVAIITVKNFGDIKVKFFKDIAPKAVENFVTHSKNGYYIFLCGSKKHPENRHFRHSVQRKYTQNAAKS